MIKINKLIQILSDMEIDTKDYDTKDNNFIKGLYNKNPSLAITAIIKNNKWYYLEIMRDYTDINEDFMVGALFDSVNEAIKNYDADSVNKSYIIISGSIFKFKINDRVKYYNADKRSLDYHNVNTVSQSVLREEGYEIENNNLYDYCQELDPFEKIELKDEIMRSDILGIRKKILLLIIESEGKITNSDIAEHFGFVKSNVTYHLQEIRENYSFFG